MNANSLEIRDLVMTLLNNPEANLVPTPFSGGVWPRLPRTGTGQLATPGAFYPNTDPVNAGKLRPTISVLDRGADPSPGGVAHNGFVAFPLVYGYSIANSDGETHLGLLEERLSALFPSRGRSYPFGTVGVKLKMLERQSLTDADDFGYPGRIFAIWRLEGTFTRPSEE